MPRLSATHNAGQARRLVLALALLGALFWGAPARAHGSESLLQHAPGGGHTVELVADARGGDAWGDMQGEEVRSYAWGETWGGGGYRHTPFWRWVANERLVMQGVEASDRPGDAREAEAVVQAPLECVEG
ncbi:hypothetical protein T484DRAFT_1807434 [Baffinella frigidus]|nr:hypothetical protein T484DRAFT_1807434 [Cryptophyta sp. CCMP2293]